MVSITIMDNCVHRRKIGSGGDKNRKIEIYYETGLNNKSTRDLGQAKVPFFIRCVAFIKKSFHAVELIQLKGRNTQTQIV